MTPEAAETLALQALAWLLGQEDLCPVFLGSTGASPEDLKARAADPEFLGAVLDFLTMDDAWVMAFCDGAGIDYRLPLAARQALPGGATPEWT